MDGFWLFGDGIKNILGFFAETANGASSAIGVVERTAVVVTHLEEDKVAGFGGIKNLVPPALGDKGSAAAPAEGMIFDADFIGVKIISDDIAPAAFAATWVVDGGVADDEENGESAIRIDKKTGTGRSVALGILIGGILRRNCAGRARENTTKPRSSKTNNFMTR